MLVTLNVRAPFERLIPNSPGFSDEPGLFYVGCMGIIENQLKHVGYELDMLIYTFDKLLLVEPLVGPRYQAGQVNALIEAFCFHARNLDEFFQGSRRDALKAVNFADGEYQPRPNDKERKDLMSKVRKQIAHLTEQRTSEAMEKIGTVERTKVFYTLIAEADNFTRHLQPQLRHAWKYAPGVQQPVEIE